MRRCGPAVARCGQLWPTVVSCGELWLWPLECRHLLLAYFHPKNAF